MQNDVKPDDEIIIIVDTAQIQPYIFNSNRLRENIGASDLVRLATEKWARDASKNLPITEIYAAGGNYLAQAKYKDAKEFAHALSKQVIESAPELQLVISLHKIDAKKSLYENVQDAFAALAVQKQTRAPSAPLLGLGVTVMCQSTGLPATEYTQTINDDETSRYPASAGIIAKRKQVIWAKQHLQEKDEFKNILGDTFAFPSDFDDLGRSHGDQSLIAVVHADGNGMGDRIRLIGKGKTDQQYKDEIKAFSLALEKATLQALRDVLQALVGHIKREAYRSDDGTTQNRYVISHEMAPEEGKPKQADRREIARIVLRDAPADKTMLLIGKDYSEADLEKPYCFERNRVYLPFVPIVIGGDDVTFVCDGRLGLSLAKLYLERFNHHTQNLPDGKGAATACAGVAIVKTHYPFSRAYQLAEELCSNAKKFRKTAKCANKNWDGSVLDWHYALSGLSGNVEEIRRREYTARWQDTSASLVQRPLTIGDNPMNALCTWDALKKGIDAFQHEDWLSRRNKMKSLREVLRQGPDAVQRFITLYGLDSDKLPEPKRRLPPVLDDSNTDKQGNIRNTGWLVTKLKIEQKDKPQDIEKQNENKQPVEEFEYTCGYFDAIELADLHVPIELKEAATPAQPKEQVVA